MRIYNDNQSYAKENWDENAEYTDLSDTGSYEDYDEYDDEEEYGIDEELGSEHNFRIAMNVFDLISMLVGIVVILVLAALLFGLFDWVQKDITQTLSVFTAPFQT